VNKPFDPELYERYNRPAIEAVVNRLQRMGWFTQNIEDCGPDIHILNEDNERRDIEVEVKVGWGDEPFPHPTVHIPLRRKKEGYDQRWYYVLNKPLTRAVIIHGVQLLSAPVVDVPNRLMAKENFWDVPLNNAGRSYYEQKGIHLYQYWMPLYNVSSSEAIWHVFCI